MGTLIICVYAEQNLACVTASFIIVINERTTGVMRNLDWLVPICTREMNAVEGATWWICIFMSLSFRYWKDPMLLTTNKTKISDSHYWLFFLNLWRLNFSGNFTFQWIIKNIFQLFDDINNIFYIYLRIHCKKVKWSIYLSVHVKNHIKWTWIKKLTMGNASLFLILHPARVTSPQHHHHYRHFHHKILLLLVDKTSHLTNLTN